MGGGGSGGGRAGGGRGGAKAQETRESWIAEIKIVLHVTV